VDQAAKKVETTLVDQVAKEVETNLVDQVVKEKVEANLVMAKVAKKEVDSKEELRGRSDLQLCMGTVRLPV
jgi:hypothetical protein